MIELSLAQDSGQRESKPIQWLRVIARFCRNSAVNCVLYIEREIGPLADSRRITQFECPNLSENVSARVSLDGDAGINSVKKFFELTATRYLSAAFGAREATIFANRASPRSASHAGSNLS